MSDETADDRNGRAAAALDGGRALDDADEGSRAADPVLVGAVDLARAALVEVTGARAVGSALGHRVEVDGSVSLLFESRLAGYPGWEWTATLARPDGQDVPTVLEVELLPAAGALLSPDWVPWSVRLADYEAAQSEEQAAADDGDRERSSRTRRRRRTRGGVPVGADAEGEEAEGLGEPDGVADGDDDLDGSEDEDEDEDDESAGDDDLDGDDDDDLDEDGDDELDEDGDDDLDGDDGDAGRGRPLHSGDIDGVDLEGDDEDDDEESGESDDLEDDGAVEDDDPRAGRDEDEQAR